MANGLLIIGITLCVILAIMGIPKLADNSTKSKRRSIKGLSQDGVWIDIPPFDKPPKKTWSVEETMAAQNSPAMVEVRRLRAIREQENESKEEENRLTEIRKVDSLKHSPLTINDYPYYDG